ncbi:hypothetical protein [Saccharospirillum alexandrii]|uniref:hypothetical protein n=1 Tax=Saccharospirillum alexandrii TaxID=2448477 RepID=UPI000FD99E94|nr:hypothetical protein [Saccharospirillum alexandrii]
MRTYTALIASLALLAGCSSVPLSKVDTEELEVTVDYRQLPDRVELETQWRTGFWNRRVDATANPPELLTRGGEILVLNRGADDGEYSLSLDPETGPYRLTIPDLAELRLPVGETVSLAGASSIAGDRFDREDELVLSVRGATDRPRGWSFTAWCGNESWTINRSLPRDETELELDLGRLMQQINNAAEADLNGQIRVRVSLWEAFDMDWQPPFKPGVARAEDRVEFEVNTASFRFQATVRIQLAQNAFFSLQNQAWPVRYCS